MQPLEKAIQAMSGITSIWDVSGAAPVIKEGLVDAAKRIESLEADVAKLKAASATK